MQDLLNKYNVPAPRYTSYPTVPLWDSDAFNLEGWINSLNRHPAKAEEGISLYIHLPFCESLCTFCGCHKRITKNHAVEDDYIDAVIKEWELYLKELPYAPRITEMHLGGGTPTFFSPDNLVRLIKSILNTAETTNQTNFSFEGHPRNTTKEHLTKLYDLGFNRVSFGIQDFDPEVQIAINRIQSYDEVVKVTEEVREVGYQSINYDLIYGLPFQNISSIEKSIDLLTELRPDRIAYYSYAHVPWIKGTGQRKFTEKDLPTTEEKMAMYSLGKSKLGSLGYKEIALDHFALPQDELFKVFRAGKLHRNFMGYTECDSQVSIGLGVSSISDSWEGMAQNIKDLKTYYEMVSAEIIPVCKGHIRTEEDKIIRASINALMCQLETRLDEDFPGYNDIINRLSDLFADDLIEFRDNTLLVTERGKPFLRNIAMSFDLRLWDNKPASQLFSMSV